MFKIFESADEKKWYEKSIRMLKEHTIWKEEDEIFWLATLNMILGEFAEVMIDEQWEWKFKDCLDEVGFTSIDLIKFVDNQEIEIPIEIIKRYIESNDLKGLPSYGLDDMLEEIKWYDEKDFIGECLYDYHIKLKDIFIEVLMEEFNNNTMKILFFFYCNTGDIDTAISYWDGSSGLYELLDYDVNGGFIDDDYSEVERLLYDYVCVDENCVMSVYSWIDNEMNY